MSLDPSTFERTHVLRFVERKITDGKRTSVVRVLQQWWAPKMPDYMRGSEGVWRDVPMESES